MKNDDDSNQVIDSQIASMCKNKCLITADDCDMVFFDLETSGFGSSHEILQIAVIREEYEFSIYASPIKEISSKSSIHTGLRNIAGQLYLHDKKVETLPLQDALM